MKRLKLTFIALLLLTVNVFAQSYEADILSFNFPEETGTAIINTLNHTIGIEVENISDFSESLSDKVLKAVPEAISIIEKELEKILN